MEDIATLYKRGREELAPAPMIASSVRLALFEVVMKHPEVTVAAQDQLPRVPLLGQTSTFLERAITAEHKRRYKETRTMGF